MKFGMLSAAAVLVASFFVLEAPAQEAIKSTGTIVSSDYRTVQQPARTGLFSRMRNRNVNTNVTPASMTTTAPQTVAPATIVPASGTTTVVPSTTTTVLPESATPVSQPRQGLFGRLRARMSR